MMQIVASLIWVWVIMVLLLLGGCSWFRPPPEQGLAPGATIVYTGSPGSELFSVCDKGNLVYLTRTNPQIAVLKDGCNPDVGKPGGPTPLGLAALSERTPPATPPPFTVPQPFLVQIVRDPHAPAAPPQVDNTLPEPRERIIVIPPPACPTCPTLPEVPPGWVPPGWTPPPAVPQTRESAPASRQAPAKKAAVVAQVDPNTASVDDLERLPGVSLKMAQEIQRKRPYRSVQELTTKKALTDAEYAALWPYFIIR